MLQAQRPLRIFGVELVVAGFRLHIDVVEQAVDHVAVGIDDAVAHDDFWSASLRRVAREGQGFQPVLLTRGLEVGIEQIKIDQRLFLRPELHRPRQAQPLLIVRQPSVARKARRIDIRPPRIGKG